MIGWVDADAYQAFSHYQLMATTLTRLGSIILYTITRKERVVDVSHSHNSLARCHSIGSISLSITGSGWM